MRRTYIICLLFGHKWPELDTVKMARNGMVRQCVRCDTEHPGDRRFVDIVKTVDLNEQDATS